MARNILRWTRAGRLDPRPQHLILIFFNLLQVAAYRNGETGGATGDLHLAECAVEDEGFLGPGCLGELGHPLGEAVAGVVVGPSYVSVVGPLLIPNVDDGDAGIAGHGHQLRRRHVGHAPPSHCPAAGAGAPGERGEGKGGLERFFLLLGSVFTHGPLKRRLYFSTQDLVGSLSLDRPTYWIGNMLVSWASLLVWWPRHGLTP
jgi:hypothetical protein